LFIILSFVRSLVYKKRKSSNSKQINLCIYDFFLNDCWLHSSFLRDSFLCVCVDVLLSFIIKKMLLVERKQKAQERGKKRRGRNKMHEQLPDGQRPWVATHSTISNIAEWEKTRVYSYIYIHYRHIKNGPFFCSSSFSFVSFLYPSFSLSLVLSFSIINTNYRVESHS